MNKKQIEKLCDKQEDLFKKIIDNSNLNPEVTFWMLANIIDIESILTEYYNDKNNITW